MTNLHLGNRACVSGPLNGADYSAGVRGKTGDYARSVGEVRLLPAVHNAVPAPKPLAQPPTLVTPFMAMDRHPWVRTWRPPV